MSSFLDSLMYEFHKLGEDDEHRLGYHMHQLATEEEWKNNYVFRYKGYYICFSPCRTRFPFLKVTSAYTLGCFYYGSYVLLEPYMVTEANLSSDTVIFEDDYINHKKIGVDFPIHLLC